MTRRLKLPTTKSGGQYPLGRQCAALPFKQDHDETLVMLLTSRESGRWVLPKGWVEKALTGAQLAAKEAYEEGGIIGEINPKPLGSFRYAKHLPLGRALECAVEVFPLRVTALLDTWPEMGQRRREWFTPSQAAMQVDESDLVIILLQLGLHHADLSRLT